MERKEYNQQLRKKLDILETTGQIEMIAHKFGVYVAYVHSNYPTRTWLWLIKNSKYMELKNDQLIIV